MARREEMRTVQVPQTNRYAIYTCDYCRQITVESPFDKRGYCTYPDAWRRVTLEDLRSGVGVLNYGVDYLDACGKCVIGIREGMAKRAAASAPSTPTPTPTPKGETK